MSERVEYFDVLRGLAIIGVVAIHSSGSGLQFGADSVNFNFTVAWRNFLNFSVPLFLAISGYFLAKKSNRSKAEHFLFLQKQIPRVYIPLVIWSSVWLVFAVVQNRSVAYEAVKLLTFQSSGPYYFIALIIQFYLFLPLFKKLANMQGLIISVLISLATTLVIFYFRYYTEVSLPLVIYAGNFITWQMFFVLGLYLGLTGEVKMKNKHLVSIVSIFYLLSCAESYFLYFLFDQAADAVTAVKTSSFLYSFFLIMLLFKNHDLIKSELLKRMGEVSFGIYLIHMFSLMAMSKIIMGFSLEIKEITWVYQLCLVTLVLSSCYLLIKACNKILTNRQAQLLGFK